MTHGPPPTAAESSRRSSESNQIPQNVPSQVQAPSANTHLNGHFPQSIPTTGYNPYISLYSGTGTTTPATPTASTSVPTTTGPIPQHTQASWPSSANANWYHHYYNVQQQGTSSAWYHYTPSTGTPKPPQSNPTAMPVLASVVGKPLSRGKPPDSSSTLEKPPDTRPEFSPSATKTTEPEPEPTHWDTHIRAFLLEANLFETLKAFDTDMLVLSPEWEARGVYPAVARLSQKLRGGEKEKERDDEHDREKEKENLDTRKLVYATTQLRAGEQARTPTSMIKSISQLLAKNRARNNASNRTEFLYTLGERRRRVAEAVASSASTSNTDETSNTNTATTTNTTTNTSTSTLPDIASCARTDARPIDRDAQMRYDIAKNSDGPLSRTRVRSKAGAGAGVGTASGVGINTTGSGIGSMKRKAEELGTEEEGDGESGERRVRRKSEHEGREERENEEEEGTPTRYPALDERLRSVEAHLGVRYVPSPPRTLLSRLTLLEEHIVKLEKEYPPWAALWFCQPGRGWPPPPRTTPVIVPAHMRSSTYGPPPVPVPGPVPPITDLTNTTLNTTFTPTPTLTVKSHYRATNTDGNEAGGVKTEDGDTSFGVSGSGSAPGLLPPAPTSTSIFTPTTTTGGRKKKEPKQRSSLHRAVMEKLEVKKALEDFHRG